jgi:hypothetical protein
VRVIEEVVSFWTQQGYWWAVSQNQPQ